MKTRPVPQALARSPLLLSLALALGVLCGCRGGGSPPPHPPGWGVTGKARVEMDRTEALLGEELAFRCVAEHSGGQDLTYHFDLAGAAGHSLTRGPFASGTAGEVTATLTQAGVFPVSCRATDPGGSPGDWSEQVALTVVDPAPPGTFPVDVVVYGHGKVTSTPAGIDCGALCATRFKAETTVTLEATPEAGWVFTGWFGCDGRSGPYTFTLEARGERCMARFAPDPERAADWRRVDATSPQFVGWSPDGKWLAAFDASTSYPDHVALRVWDAESGKVKRLFRLDGKHFGTVAWSPRSTVLAAGRSDGVIALLDLETGATVREWKAHEGGVRALAWSPDGMRLASADNTREVRFWSTATGSGEDGSFTLMRPVRRLAWSPDGSRLAAETGTALIELSWVEIHVLGANAPGQLVDRAVSFAWSPDGARFAAGGVHDVRVYSTASAELLATWRGTWGQTNLLDWSPDGKWLAVGGPGGNQRVLEADTGALVVDISEELRSPYGTQGYDTLRFHPFKPELAAVADFPETVNVFTLDAEAHTATRRELIPHLSVEQVAWSPTGERLATGGLEGRIRIWGRDGEPLRTLPGHGLRAVIALAWSGDGSLLASSGEDGHASVWNVADGTRVGQPIVHAERTEVTQVALSPDGTRLATVETSYAVMGHPGKVRLWDVRLGLERTLPSGGGVPSVRGLQWTPDGRSLVAFHSDMTWSLWDLRESTYRRVHSGQDASTLGTLAAALSPDGTRVALGGRPGLTLHDAATGELLARAKHDFDPYALAWSPDGERLAGSGTSGLVYVWDTRVANPTGTIVGGVDGFIGTLSWRADGRVLTTGGSDGVGSPLVTWRLAP